jgi:DnaK suppressor protein
MSLSVDAIDSISNQLNSRLLDLRKSIGDNLSTSHLQGACEQGGNDRGDESNHELQINLELTQANRDSDEQRLIEEALERLKTGAFGICVNCDNEINAQRLVANPIAKRCLDCQAAHEDHQDERDSTPSL